MLDFIKGFADLFAIASRIASWLGDTTFTAEQRRLPAAPTCALVLFRQPYAAEQERLLRDTLEGLGIPPDRATPRLLEEGGHLMSVRLPPVERETWRRLAEVLSFDERCAAVHCVRYVQSPAEEGWWTFQGGKRTQGRHQLATKDRKLRGLRGAEAEAHVARAWPLAVLARNLGLKERATLVAALV